MASHEQVRERCKHVDLAAVLEHATQAGLLKTELPLDHAKRMLDFRTDVSLGGLDQIIQPAFRGIGESTPLPRPHRDAEADGLGFHLFSLLDPLVASIGVDHCLLPMQELCGWGQVVDVGSGCLH